MPPDRSLVSFNSMLILDDDEDYDIPMNCLRILLSRWIIIGGRGRLTTVVAGQYWISYLIPSPAAVTKMTCTAVFCF